MNNKRTFYKIYYKNSFLTLEFLEKEIADIYGSLVNIYIANNEYNIFKISNAFIKLNEEVLKKKSEDYDIYVNLIAELLLDFDRSKRIIETRSGNFGELRYDPINKKINKFSYDGDGKDTENYRKKNNLLLKSEYINLSEIKKEYKIQDESVYSSFDIIDSKSGSYLIKYKNLEHLDITNTTKSYGDLMDITIITNDNRVISYINVFGNFEKELLLGENIDSRTYKDQLGYILLDLERNERVINQRSGNFGRLIYDPVLRKINKYINNTQIDNIDYLRSNYGYKLEIKEKS